MTHDAGTYRSSGVSSSLSLLPVLFNERYIPELNHGSLATLRTGTGWENQVADLLRSTYKPANTAMPNRKTVKR